MAVNFDIAITKNSVAQTSNTSLENLVSGDVIVCEIVQAFFSYKWTLAFKPDGSSASLPLDDESSCTFTVDIPGAYILRAVIDPGLPDESVKFLRFRIPTEFGDLRLVGAGERYDDTGIVPTDANAESGWASTQNKNIQRVLSLVQKISHTGRVLYVDANRGFGDENQAQNDRTNTYALPGGADTVPVVGFGDFSSIQVAIDYAVSELSPSGSNPVWIKVRSGVYDEELIFAPHVHLIADFQINTDDIQSPVLVKTTGPGEITHLFPGASLSEFLIIKGITFEYSGGLTDPLFRQDGGIVVFDQSIILQKSPGIGAAIQITEGELYVVNNSMVYKATSETTNGYPAILSEGESSVYIWNDVTVSGPSGLWVNLDAEDVPTSVQILDSQVLSNETEDTGYCIYGPVSDLVLRGSVLSTVSPSTCINITPLSGQLTSALDLSITNCDIAGDIVFDTASTTIAAASNTVSLGRSQYRTLVFPSDNPTVSATTLATTIHYDSDYTDPKGLVPPIDPLKQLPVDNVQEAIDRLVRAILPESVAPFNTLQSGYDGILGFDPVTGLPQIGTGAGRKIVTNSGAVQIEAESRLTADDPTNADRDGGLQVNEMLELGAFQTDTVGGDILVWAKPFGGGPALHFGRLAHSDTYTSWGFHSGFPGVSFMARNVINENVPFNFLIGAQNGVSSVTGEIGRSVVFGGTLRSNDALETTKGGGVFLQAGAFETDNIEPVTAGGTPNDGLIGHVWLVPGRVQKTAPVVGNNPTGADRRGRVRIVGSGIDDATAAKLTAANVPQVPAYSGSGYVWFDTPQGYQVVPVASTDTINTIITWINTYSRLLKASQSGGKLVLESVTRGPNSTVLYMGDSHSGAVNAKIGDFREDFGAVFQNGDFTTYVDLECIAQDKLRVFGEIQADAGTGGGSSLQYRACDVTVNGEVFSANSVDVFHGFTFTADGEGILNLPVLNQTGRMFTVKDESGQAGIGNRKITITPNAPESIEGAATYEIVTPYAAISFYFNGADWFIY
jgi:hypothetical protein